MNKTKPSEPQTAVAGLYSIIINWLKQGMDALELWVDRGDGKGFVFLAIDSIPVAG